ncbi:MAG: hypothetical protein JO337_05390 [Acidimicrobiales bacterium]|nr:hypothetical protein [Acidimicrobiales bacterium]
MTSPVYARVGPGVVAWFRGHRILRWRLEVTVLAVAMVVVTYALSSWPGTVGPGRTPAPLHRSASGLVATDSFDRPVPYRTLEDRYVFNGSAQPGTGYAYASATGLDVGVKPHAGWAGWFAVTIHAASPQVVWHTVMSRPGRPSTGGTGEAVFAVQTATTQHNGAINYVVVASVSRNGLTHWLVGYAHGEVADADTEVLWQSPDRADSPTSEPVTVTTDGRHQIAVWLGDQEVYRSSDLQLDIPPPFQAYLEVQGQNEGYVSRFQDFWIARAAALQVRGIPAGASVTLVHGGQTIASASADREGTARLALPAPQAVGVADLVVASARSRRTYDQLSYAAGDVLVAG